jgi:hypothetical protein
MESANSASSPALSLRPSPPRGRRLQFGLLALLGVITVLAIALGSWFYYRPLTTTVVVHFAVVDRAAANPTMAQHGSHLIDSSHYTWMILSDDGLNELLRFEGDQADLLGNGEAHVIDSWPNTAFVDAYHFVRPKIIKLGENHFAELHESAELVGTLGSRRAGRDKQFRVDCNMECQHPNIEAMAQGDDAHRKKILKAKVFYQGSLPDEHLVFIAPIDAEVFSVIIFDVKQ